jgi:DNA polymerase elongation subunit (family B)
VFTNIYVEYGSQQPPMVHLWDDTLGYQKFLFKDFDYAYKLDPNGTTISLHGHKVKKVHRWSKDDPRVLESDLPKETRVLTDLYLQSDEPAKGNKVAILDIEVDDEHGLPDVLTADKQITSIALEDKTTGEEFVFILDEDRELDDYEAADGLTVFNALTEEELLGDFLDIWEQIAPTIATGWNVDYFDIPYLYRRLIQILGEDEAFRLSPIQLVKFSDRRGKYQIAGVSVLDYLDLYKKFTYTEQPNYRLDTIGKAELGQGKYQFSGTLANLRKTDKAGFLTYNLDDARIVSKLDIKMKLIELVVGICTLGHVPYEEYGYSSRWLEGALVTDLHRKGIIAPNKSATAQEEMAAREGSGEKGFTGAFVKAPKIGRHEWVYSLDLQSLYPSIIMSLNISPETKIGKVLNWSIEGHVRKLIVEYIILDSEGNQTKISRDDFITFMTDGKFTISSNGILYRTDKVGLIAEILDRWFAERVEYRKKMKTAANEKKESEQKYWDMRQHIQKIFLNSLYGVLGLPVFRFYDVDNALAVTASGQDVIKTSAKFVNNKYQERTKTNDDYCIYIDTDSLYFSVLSWFDTMPADLKATGIQLARDMEKQLNVFYDRMAKMLFFVPDKHRFIIRGESIASAAFWVNKKRYAMRKVYDLETDQDVNKVAIKGLDVVRSSFPKAFQTFMKEVLSNILDATPKAELDAKILKFYNSMPDIPIPDVARNTAVKNLSGYSRTNQTLNDFDKKTPAHVKAAITHNLLLRHWNVHFQYKSISDGAKIKYVYLKHNPYEVESVAFFGDDTDAPLIIRLIKEFIDYDRLFENEFAHKLQDFYEALKWGVIPTKVNQKAQEFFAF